MSRTVLYVYAIGSGLSLDDISYLEESIDGAALFSVVSAEGLDAVCTAVEASQFSQEEIDKRSADLQWLGTLGYRHEAVVAQLTQRFSVIPLRAFTLFSSSEALRQYLSDEATRLLRVLEQIRGKDEWTVRLEFDPETWQSSLSRRVDALRTLEDDIAASPSGKAYLLKKKLEEGRKKAARDAEQAVVAEVERALIESLDVPTITETRQRKAGSFPQINVLIPRERSAELRALHQSLHLRYEPEGVSLVLTGPWPPYTFTSGESHE